MQRVRFSTPTARFFYEKEFSECSDGMQMDQLLDWPPEDIALCPQIEYCFAGGGSILLTFYGAYPSCDDSFADSAEYDVRLYDGLTERDDVSVIR